MAVSGDRRSWETARSTAVLITSLRRSASVSTTSAWRPSRSSAAASSASSDGTMRSCSRRSVVSGRSDGTSSVPIWRLPSRRGKAIRLVPASTLDGSMAADGTSRVWARRRATSDSDGPRAPPWSSSRAISAARSASRRRSSASAARARASSEIELARIAAMRKTTSATQFSESAIVNRPVGGMWKKLKASALATAVATPSHGAPDPGDQQDRDEVDDAERQRRGDLLERVEEQRRQRDGADGGGQSDPARRRVGSQHERGGATEHGGRLAPPRAAARPGRSSTT